MCVCVYTKETIGHIQPYSTLDGPPLDASDDRIDDRRIDDLCFFSTHTNIQDGSDRPRLRFCPVPYCVIPPISPTRLLHLHLQHVGYRGYRRLYVPSSVTCSRTPLAVQPRLNHSIISLDRSAESTLFPHLHHVQHDGSLFSTGYEVAPTGPPLPIPCRDTPFNLGYDMVTSSYL